MSDHEHDDEKFDGWLREAAQGYHRPPPQVPRDEMWHAIQATRGTVAPAAPIATGGRWTPRLWQMAAGAVLLLGSGVVIGRGMRSSAPEGAGSIAAVAPDSGAATDRSTAVVAGRGEPAPASRGTLVAPRGREAAGGEVYAVATVDHLARAEALLTSFKGTVNDSVDVSLEKWARDLLADTRLLLDSPAATDTRRRHLLEDLELVLAQIVQLRAESSADRNLVRRSIERGEVLTRIRSTIPAGSSSGV